MTETSMKDLYLETVVGMLKTVINVEKPVSLSGEVPYITQDVQVKDVSDPGGLRVTIDFPENGPNISDFETWQVQYRKATEQNWLVAMFSINSTSAQVNLSSSGPYAFQVSAVEMAISGQVSAAQVLQICELSGVG